MVGNNKKYHLSNKNMFMKNKILTATLAATCWLHILRAKTVRMNI